MALVRPSERYIEKKQTELETESKYNTADNAGITRSQARDTRYRRMQELNSFRMSVYLTDSVCLGLYQNNEFTAGP